MKAWIVFIMVILVCIIGVGAVYVSRFGWPKFENKEEKMLQNIVGYISDTFLKEQNENYTIKIIIEENNIKFSKQYLNEQKPTEVVTFTYEDSTISTVLIEDIVSKDFFDETIQMIFESVAVYNGYSAENARYSLTKDILDTKTFEADGFQYTSINNVDRFIVAVNKKLKLAEKNEVFIKPVDLDASKDVLISRLQYKLIEKPGIVLEKNISYSRNLVFVIYEKEGLTQRTYNSLLSILDVVVDNNKTTDYVKANYPVITKAGTIILDGIEISLNEGLGEGNVHYYDMPEDYEYMLIKINIDKHIN